MMMSILAMYTYDDTLFDGLELPTYQDPETEVVHTINKDTVIKNILLHCAELEVVYPEWDTMKLAIGVWSASQFKTWEKLFATTMMSYNPIWNVDADESETFSRNYLRNMEYDSQDKRTADLTDERTPDLTTERTPDLVETKSVQGFNSNTWADAEKIATTGTDTTTNTGTETNTETGTDTVTHTGTDTIDYSGKDTDSGLESTTLIKRRTGNIGVTTTQKMISEEREIAEFSMIEYITQSFKERFCILIY